jgi:3-deoxy-D-arabino-heptulosonate 7-phosphate (DAHP) synthase
MKTKLGLYSLGLALLCAFAAPAAAQNRVTQEVLPKPEQAFSDAKIGRTYKDSKP